MYTLSKHASINRATPMMYILPHEENRSITLRCLKHAHVMSNYTVRVSCVPISNSMYSQSQQMKLSCTSHHQTESRAF